MRLFHKKVIDKIIDQKVEIPADHLAILENWALSIQDGSIYRQNETQIESDFKERIVQGLLGYKTFSSSGDDYHVIPQYPIAGKRVDLALGHFNKHDDSKNECIAPFELKGAKTVLDAIMSGRNKTPVQQAWDYAMDVKGAKWVLVSNYVEIRLYAVGYGRQDYERFPLELLTDPKEYQRFYQLLCKENLLGGQTHDWLKQSEAQDKDITNRLYQDYKIIRHNVIHAIQDNNKEVVFEDAVGMAQVILDRVLFIAFAEDKGLLPSDSLKQAYEHKDPYNPKPVWENFKGLFRSIDEGNPSLNIPKYNGGLFAFNPTIDNLELTDEIFQGFKKIGDYDFQSEISVTILGHIFEQSISDIEALKEFGDLNLKIKDGKRKKEGVVYTPDSITRFIVEKTLGDYVVKRRTELLEDFITKGSWQQFKVGESTAGEPLAKWKSQAAELEYWRSYQELLKTIRIVDPACGSGAFLVAAFDYMYGEYDRVNIRIAELRGGTGDVFDLNKEILNNNLYGVDINPESIEITKLSLWLKTAQRGKILNSLDDNLRVGDSVIEDSSFTHRAFSWKEAFPEVFEDGGFDVVLGNPPYVRMEYLKELKPYLEKRYEVTSDRADLYAYFFELGLRILKPNTGRMGYISSNTFFKTGSGENLRKYLLDNTQVDLIIDFGDIQVFEGVTTYPAILIFTKNNDNKNTKANILQLENEIEQDISYHFSLHSKTMPQSWLNQKTWELQSEEHFNLKEKMLGCGNTLKHAYGIPLYGIKTGCNDAFVITADDRKNIISENPSEEVLIKRFFEGKDANPWHIQSRNLYIIYIPKNFIDIENYPSIKKHLIKYYDALNSRATKQNWFELQQPQQAYEKYFLNPKIIFPEISQGAKFSIDYEGRYYQNTVYSIPTADTYLLGLLNSKAVWFFYQQTCAALRGGTWRLRLLKQYIEKTPIPKAADVKKERIGILANKAQETAEQRYALQEQVRNRIHDIASEGKAFDLNNKLKSWWKLDFKEFQKEIKKVFKAELSLNQRDEWETYITDKQKQVEALTNTLTAIENDLDSEVYSLFDLTPDEIKLIEESV